MILSEITAGKQMILGGVSCRTPSKVIQLPTVEDLICSCEFVSSSCNYEELAFAYPTNELDTYRNDFKSILITLLDASSSYEFFLVDSNDVEIPLLDGVHGTLYGLGFNTLQPLKVGFRIDWLKVFNLLSGDIYKIRIKQTDFENTIVVDSHSIKLMQFSELASQDTTKIQTTQKGVYLSGEDYEGMNWVNMNRIVANFGNEKQQTEISRLKDGNYQDFDIQNEYYYQYTLETNLLPSPIADFLLNSDIKTDEILISNYDVYAYRQYRDLPVIHEGTIDASDDYATNINKRFTITFNDSITNLKRNFQ
tara:strand:+ start:270 stop:1193 length:924 start_codon:yes stop_codon:yes gene_type:complete